MAFKKDITDTRFGNTFSGAYIKLAYFRWSDADNKAVATFSVFSSSESKNDGKEAVENIEINVTDEFADLQEKLYNKAKLMPEFSGAIDA